MKNFLLLIFTVISISAFSQTDTKAKEILDKVSAATKTYKTIEAEFNFTVDDKQSKKTTTHKGKLYVKGNKYRIDIMSNETYFDGKTMWTYMKESNECNISEPDPNDESTLNPAKMFTIYEKGFKYKYIGERFESARQLYDIELYPTDLKKDFSMIKLKIDKSKNQVYSFKRVGKDGVSQIIEVTKIVTNEDIPDSRFTFDKAAHPGVEVIDMR